MKYFFFLTIFLWHGLAFADKPEVLDVKAIKTDSGYNFEVTVKHADEGWKHYTDNFEILAPNGKLIARRVLQHPHVDEQPFTRGKFGVKIPPAMKVVLVRAHDSKHGNGKAIKVRLP